MDSDENRRQHPRITLDGLFTVRFEVEARVFRGVEMTNLSAGGVGLRMELEDTALIEPGTLLRNLVLEHPSLPTVRVDGEVRHILGRHPGRVSGPVFLGVQFRSPPEAFVRQLDLFIQRRLG
jgi:c-di-GMP-binding flagellar brake protein YcgR